MGVKLMVGTHRWHGDYSFLTKIYMLYFTFIFINRVDYMDKMANYNIYIYIYIDIEIYMHIYIYCNFVYIYTYLHI